jgi:hypothetical protein
MSGWKFSAPMSRMAGKVLWGLAAATLIGAAAVAQTAAEPSALFPLKDEPPPKLFVSPPLPGPLARGAVLIQYRLENFRILPVTGEGALTVSPRAGHLHVNVDDLPWVWADTGGANTIVVNGLPPGEHKVRIELADPTHHIYTGQTVTFIVPAM